MVVDINSSKKTIFENNQRLDQQLKEAVDEINRLNNVIKKLKKDYKTNKCNDYLLNNYNEEIYNECYYIDEVNENIKQDIVLKPDFKDNVNINDKINDKQTNNLTQAYIPPKVENTNNVDLENKLDDISPTSDNSNNIKDNKVIKKDKIIYEDLSFDGCPIISINNINDLNIGWKEHISTEIYKIIKENNILYEKINLDGNIDKNTLDQAIDFIIIKREFKDTKQNRSYIRYSIKRSFYLYKEYNKELKYINFSFNKMIRLSEENWNYFLIYIKDKINQVRSEQTKLKKLEKINELEDLIVKNNDNQIELNDAGPSTTITNDNVNINIIKEDENKTEETVIVDKKKNNKIKRDIKKIKVILDRPGDINYNNTLCLACQRNPRTNSSFCDKCTKTV